MTVAAFNTAANAAQPYVFDLGRETAALYREHPDQKKTLFFIDASHLPGKLYRSDEMDGNQIAKRLNENSHLLDAITKTHKTGKGGSVRYNEEGYSCIILKMPRNQRDVNLLGYAAPSDVTDVFSFDHEIGHLLCPGGYENKSPRMKERIADAYAIIRHFQRFGADAEAIKNLTAMRTVEMILGRDDSHFTAPITEKIIADGEKGKFSALTPAQTVAKAQDYAAKNEIDEQLINYMTNNFNNLHLDATKLLQGDFAALGKFGAFLLKTEIAEEFHWGAVAIRAMHDGNIGIDGLHLPKPSGPQWTQLHQSLDTRAALFEQPQKPKFIVVSTPLSF